MDHQELPPVEENVSQEMMEDAMETALYLKKLRLASPPNSSIWKELYANKEHHDKIIEKDVQLTVRTRQKLEKEQGTYLVAKQVVQPISYEERKKRLMRHLGL